MAAVAGRKKSIVSTTGIPVANNTLLNKAAITSLYQECSRLRARLMTLKGFEHYFDLVTTPDTRQSTDTVTQLWDLFSFGIPLCYIFDQLPDQEGFNRINNSSFNDDFEANPDRAKKHAIALFAMRIRSDAVLQQIKGCELFTISDLWDRNLDSTDGFVKVIQTVSAIVRHIPEDRFEAVPSSPPTIPSPNPADPLGEPSTSLSGQEAARNNIVREMVETERKYVQDLEIMQKYAAALAQSNVIDQDTIHLLFPNLNKLLNFQRKFLIRLESTAETAWPDQRWGQQFLETEEEWFVYEPYCANYISASDLMLANEQNLSALNHLINVKGELPAFLIKPIQRVCKYPLLLDSLIKACQPDSYPYYDELKAGSGSAKRIADKINEAQRHAENEQTVKNLQSRVEDWKGHHLENFGQLLLDDIFVVTKSDIDREYHVFLFEKIILCCKEALPAAPNGKKVGKSNSLLKKQTSSPNPMTPTGQPARKNTPLLLKGRIFLGNVTRAVPASPRNSTSSSMITHYPLAVWWKGDDDLEYFTLRCRREDQMKQWESTINRLINETAQRRVSEQRSTMSSMSRSAANSTSPALARMTSGSGSHYPSISSSIGSSTAVHPSGVSTRSRGNSTAYSSEGTVVNNYGAPQDYPSNDGFEMEGEEDEYEDYPAYAPSGRGTPMTMRRTGDFDRSGLNGTDWRASNGPSPVPGHVRPITPRLTSNASYQSDASFGNGVAPQTQPRRPPLKSQFSSSKLRSGYESGGSNDFRGPNTATIPRTTPPPLNGHVPVNRSRSASQPSTFVPKSIPPPLPTTQWNNRSDMSASSGKRGSGSSQSTGGDSSDYSPNSSSPITPFGSSESSLNIHGARDAQQVKIKVHFHEDIFVIQVSRSTEYEDLVEKVGRKIRLCGARRDDGPLRVKYRDEDGDMVSLGSTEDVQMAFEQYRPGGQVVIFVQ